MRILVDWVKIADFFIISLIFGQSTFLQQSLCLNLFQSKVHFFIESLNTLKSRYSNKQGLKMLHAHCDRRIFHSTQNIFEW